MALTIAENPAPLTWESAEPVNGRHEELLWLAKESPIAPYAGEWVAHDAPRLVPHGEKLAEVSTAVMAAGITIPVATKASSCRRSFALVQNGSVWRIDR